MLLSRRTLFALLIFSLIALHLQIDAAETIAAEDTPSLFDEAANVSKLLDPEVDLDFCKQKFEELVRKVEVSLKNAKEVPGKSDLSPAEIIDIMNREILVSRKVTYISHKYWRDSLFTSALTKNQGNCAATSLLYFLIAQRLNLPIYMAFAPTHAFVRWDDGKNIINIETTRQGATRTDKEVMRKFYLESADLAPNGFIQTLSINQIRAHMRAIWSHVFFSMNRRDEAHRFIALSREADPQAKHTQLTEAYYLLVEGHAEEAKNIYVESMKSAVGPWAVASARLAYSNYLVTRGKFDEALEILRSGFNEAPILMQLKFARALGSNYRVRRDYAHAIPFYQALAMGKPDEHNYLSLAVVLSEARRNTESIEYLEKAAALNPEDSLIQVFRAVLYDRIGEKEKSREIASKFEEPRDLKINWHRCMAFYFANLKDETQMLAHMSAAFKLDASGSSYQYFQREQDMDPYRNGTEFKKMMEQNKPTVDTVVPEDSLD